MKRHLKKGAEKARSVKYRITIFTVFLLVVYGIGLWHFKYFDSRVEIMDGLDLEKYNRSQMEEGISEMVKGYPIEEMVEHIAAKEPKVAAFLVSIAKKESNWGKRVPVLNGQDCYNYWGYRGIRERMGTGGHTCFDSRKDAVDTVAKRIEELVNENNLDTPQKMIVWKCGSSCAGHSSYGVKKWILDVGYYFEKLIN